VYGSLQMPEAARAGGRKSDIAAQPLTSKASRTNVSFRVVFMPIQMKSTSQRAGVAYSSHYRGRSLHPRTTHRSGLR